MRTREHLSTAYSQRRQRIKRIKETNICSVVCWGVLGAAEKEEEEEEEEGAWVWSCEM